MKGEGLDTMGKLVSTQAVKVAKSEINVLLACSGCERPRSALCHDC